MSTQLVLAILTKGGATLEIISFLVVSAIIGYVTAYLYTRSVYSEKLKDVESDKHELNNRIINLDGIISGLRKNISEMEIEMQTRELEADALAAISERKQLLDYNSFGTATEAEKDDLTMISGIGPFIEKRLNALDIYTFRQISKLSPKDIHALNDAIIYFSGRIERDEWVEQAVELIGTDELRTGLFERIEARKVKYSF